MLGPVPELSSSKILPTLEERYCVISYADDLKPAITSMEEFFFVNDASALLEAASGYRLQSEVQISSTWIIKEYSQTRRLTSILPVHL